jgi:hypothetical protein
MKKGLPFIKKKNNKILRNIARCVGVYQREIEKEKGYSISYGIFTGVHKN